VDDGDEIGNRPSRPREPAPTSTRDGVVGAGGRPVKPTADPDMITHEESLHELVMQSHQDDFEDISGLELMFVAGMLV
jgi:hypothetical protein